MGEALFRYLRPGPVERVLHGPADPVRRNMINSIGTVSRRQFKLDQLGLVPRGTMEGIVKGAIGLATEGFFEGVSAGRIRVHRDTTVVRLLAVDGRPHAELSNGSTVPADLVVCATGFTQGGDAQGARQAAGSAGPRSRRRHPGRLRRRCREWTPRA